MYYLLPELRLCYPSPHPPSSIDCCMYCYSESCVGHHLSHYCILSSLSVSTLSSLCWAPLVSLLHPLVSVCLHLILLVLGTTCLTTASSRLCLSPPYPPCVGHHLSHYCILSSLSVSTLPSLCWAPLVSLLHPLVSVCLHLILLVLGTTCLTTASSRLCLSPPYPPCVGHHLSHYCILSSLSVSTLPSLCWAPLVSLLHPLVSVCLHLTLLVLGTTCLTTASSRLCLSPPYPPCVGHHLSHYCILSSLSVSTLSSLCWAPLISLLHPLVSVCLHLILLVLGTTCLATASSRLCLSPPYPPCVGHHLSHYCILSSLSPPYLLFSILLSFLILYSLFSLDCNFLTNSLHLF